MSHWTYRTCRWSTGLVALALASGCSGTVVTTSDATSTTTMAFISFEHTTPAVSSSNTQADAAADADSAATTPAARPAATSMYAAAAFLRVWGGADEKVAAHLVGADLFLPELGHCAPVETLRDNGLTSVNPIDLIDVGEVTVETETAKAILAARVFPDIADLISGVLYTTRDGASTNLPGAGTYRLRVTGSPTFPPTVVQAMAPGPISGLLVDDRPVQTDPLLLERGDVSIQWSPSGADLVYVDLASTDDGFAERVRCAFPDVGHGILPAGILPHSPAQRLSVHQLHGEPVREPGVDSGEIRFDEAATANLRFETTQP